MEEGRSPLQIRILGFLDAHVNEGIGVARLAEELMVSKPTISDSVKLLADRKLVVRKADKRNARSHALHLTNADNRHVSAGTPMDAAVSELPREHKEALLTVLMGVLEALFRKEALHVQRMCFTCTYYQGDRNMDHRCHLLERSLPVAELRTDCAEHKVV